MPQLLLTLKHWTFEEWFLRLMRQGLLPQDCFQLADLEAEYLRLCWKEEELYEKWRNGNHAKE